MKSQTRTLSLTVLLVLGMALGAVAETAPQPNVVSSAWQLSVKFDAPRVISYRLPSDDQPRLYLYMTYTVANETGEDQMFIPDLWLLTDGGDLLQANRGVAPSVFKAIKKYLDNPLLESPTQIVGKILQGKDNARDGVAIWPVPDHDVDMLRIFFGGLSGEVHEVTDANTGEKHLLRKTLMVEYQAPGDRAHMAIKPFIKKKQDWVVR
ncbi:hypothetical protein HED60_03720 [Planctomycetales bacterium ZRK34]|nr:hypothetical protein HED60_03720 [Planctomycetales bacterium ZRK34]